MTVGGEPEAPGWRAWLRVGAEREFAAGWAWAAPRCRTPHERALLPPLLALLLPWQAVVTPARRGPDRVLDLRITFGRRDASGRQHRRRFRVVSASREELPADDAPVLWLSPDSLLADPWDAAARVVAWMLAQLDATAPVEG